MRVVFFTLVAALLASAATAAELSLDERDQVRGLLARVDNEARTAWLHPDEARPNAAAAARYARAAAWQLRTRAGMPLEAAELARAAADLDDAARRRDPVDVQSRAAVMQIEVRRIDSALPPATLNAR
jgi:hypothetical protein